MRTALLIAILLTQTATAAKRTLIWSDEFNGPAGAAPDSANWIFDLGAGGWGNRELETYTDSRDNSFLDGHGHLVIRVIKTADGYTSARLKSKGKREFEYGRIEARIKVPFGQGIWPAFWMLGADFPTTRWPNCGEIDIMETIGKEPGVVHGTIHGPGYSGGQGPTSQTSLPGGKKLSDKFHIFAVEWNADSIAFFLDGKQYSRFTHDSIPKDAKWVYDHPFYLLLNVAVGGNWPGNPDSASSYPQTMLVDWIRVWK